MEHSFLVNSSKVNKFWTAKLLGSLNFEAKYIHFKILFPTILGFQLFYYIFQ